MEGSRRRFKRDDSFLRYVQPPKVAIINKRKTLYDATFDSQTKEYPSLEYIGTGLIHSINGIKQDYPKKLFFYRRKE